jgi:uncharacterized membrane protein YphA (DoxX/SURF4 family)
MMPRTISLLVVFALGTRALAHEKWFHEGPRPPLELATALAPPNVFFVLLGLAVTGAAALLWRARNYRSFLPGPDVFGGQGGRRSALYGLVPAILGVHVAVPLLVSGVQGELFAPGNPLPGAWAYLLGLVQTGVALSFFYGGFARAAAVVLALLWGLGIIVVGPEAMLENVHYLGFAGFFYLAGRGPLAVDRLIFPRLEPPAALMRRALPVMRVGVGLSLVTVAFTEKLANVPLAESFLAQYPLNFTGALGLPLPDEFFILSAGTVELIVGLFILFGIFPREIILVAWLPFNLTLTVFNWLELIGHLPFYGAMAVLLIWSPRDEGLWVEGLRGGPLAIGGSEGVANAAGGEARA